MIYRAQREAGYLFHEFLDVQNTSQLPLSLVEGAKECTDSAFGRAVDPDEVTRALAAEQVILAEDVLLRRGQVVGFSSAKIISPSERFNDDGFSPEPGLYLAGSAIRAEAQSTGLYKSFLQRRLALLQERGLNTIFTTTQNPRVQESITRSLEDLVARQQLRGYKLGSTLVKGFYGQMLTSKQPTAKEIDFSELDYANGDALRLIWELDRI